MVEVLLHVKPPGLRLFSEENNSWYEQHFAYKLVFCDPVGTSGQVPVKFPYSMDPFFDIKKIMIDEHHVWGVYREAWFAKIHNNQYIYYFMSRLTAMRFALWAPLYGSV